VLTQPKRFDDQHKVDESNEHDVELLKSTEYPSKPFKSTKQSFNLVATFVHFSVVLPRLKPVCLGGTTADSMPIGESHCLLTRDPSTNELVHRWELALMQLAFDLLPRRALDQVRVRTLWPFLHLRQPYESWLSIPRGIYRWTEDRFF
jgi:hypothetical protein